MGSSESNKHGRANDKLSLANWQRKAIYEELHPETKAGAAGADARWNATDNLSTASFAAETAKVSGKDFRRSGLAVPVLATAQGGDHSKSPSWRLGDEPG